MANPFSSSSESFAPYSPLITSLSSSSSSGSSTSSTSTTSTGYAQKKITVCALCQISNSNVNWPGVDIFNFMDPTKKPYGYFLHIRSSGSSVKLLENCDYELRFNGKEIEVDKSEHKHKDKATIQMEQVEKINKMFQKFQV